MLKKYKLLLGFIILTAALAGIVEGCGSSGSTTHAIYGSTS